MKRKFLFLIALASVLSSYAVSSTRDSVVVDSITGDVRKYKITDNKALQPL